MWWVYNLLVQSTLEKERDNLLVIKAQGKYYPQSFIETDQQTTVGVEQKSVLLLDICIFEFLELSSFYLVLIII